MVNIVPGHPIVQPGRSGRPNSENQLLLKGFSQQSQHFVALFVVWKIRLSVYTGVVVTRFGMFSLSMQDRVKQQC